MSQSFFVGRLPIPPGINRSYKSFLNPKTGKSAFAGTSQARAFKRDAVKQLSAAQIDWDVVKMIQAAKKRYKQIPLSVTIIYFFEYMWMKDVDGGIKGTVDVVFTYLNLNDNLIVKLSAEKQVDKTNPRVELSICIAEE